MSVEGPLCKYLATKSAITDLVGSNIYKRIVPARAGYPTIIVELVYERRDYEMSGQDGVLESQIDVDVYGNDTGTVGEVTEAIRNEVSGFKNGTWDTTFVQGCFIDGVSSIDEPRQFGKEYPKVGDRLQLRIYSKESAPVQT